MEYYVKWRGKSVGNNNYLRTICTNDFNQINQE